MANQVRKHALESQSASSSASSSGRIDNEDSNEGIGTRYGEPSASPGFVLWQVAAVWQRRVRTALVEVGLTHAQFALLASAGWLEAEATKHARENGGEPVTQAIVAAHARTDAVMTSEVLRTLERKGLLHRLPHPEDARARQIMLTPSGRDTVRRAIALVESVDQEFFGAPGPELQSLARLLCNGGADLRHAHPAHKHKMIAGDGNG